MPDETRIPVFLSYGRKDAGKLASSLTRDLKGKGYEPWQDTQELRGGVEWERRIKEGLRNAEVCLALLSPHSVRSSSARTSPGQDPGDSVCLDEIAFARYLDRPILPALVEPCEPPLSIFRLQYVDFTGWSDDPELYRKRLEELVECLEAARRGEFRYRSWVDRLRPWDFGAFLQEKREGFTGRSWLFDDITAWLDRDGTPSLLVVGDPGIGKSAIVAELIHKNPEGRVLAYHCCQSDTPETLEPGRFVRSLAAMMASRIPGYAERLNDTDLMELLSERASDHDPGSAFERGVLSVLRDLPAPEGGPRMLVVDALDEALLHRGRTSIVDLLRTRIRRFPDWLRFLGTTRRDAPVLDALSGLRDEEVDAEDPRNLHDLDEYVARRLAEEPLATRLAESGESAESVQQALAESSSGNFLYVTFALDAIASGRTGLDELAELPPGLLGQYEWFFERQFEEEVDRSDVEAALAVLVAGQEALPLDDLGRAAELDPETKLPGILRALAPFLRVERERTDGPPGYRLFHKSLADWLTAGERAGAPFWIHPRVGHRRLANTLFSRFRKGPEKLSTYGLRHLGSHLAALARTASEDEERAACVERLVRFAGDPEIQAIRRDEPLGVLRGLSLSLEVAARDDPETTAGVVHTLQAAMAMVHFRRTRLRPDRIFQLAEEGRLDQVEEEISLFRGDGPWRGAALLTAVWLAKPKHPQAAREMFDRIAGTGRTFDQLLDRLELVFQGGELGTEWLAPVPGGHEIEAMMVQVRGTDLEAFSGMAEGFTDPGEAPMLDEDGNMEAPGDEGVVELARVHAPGLVSFAHSFPEPGDRYLREYISLHAANSYRTYRNRALGWLLRAVVAHPDDAWCREMLVRITTGALSGAGVEFGEFVPVAQLAVRASIGSPADMEAFKNSAASARAAGETLSQIRDKSDAWGAHRRRYGVHAEGFARVLGDRRTAIDLFSAALELPYGYAGFTAPASLALAESASVASFQATAEELTALDRIIAEALEKAQESAHNVQDPTFCARSTSRVNAMRRGWWPRVTGQADFDVGQTLDRFLQLPDSAEFSALHVVAWDYPNRNEMPGTVRLPSSMRTADRLRELAVVYQRPLSELMALNPLVPDPDQPLAPGAEVRVPDPGFTPLLAARLAAELLVAPEMSEAERARGIRRLAPLAARNETALDTVMGRLLLAAKVETPTLEWQGRDSGRLDGNP